MNNEMYYIWSIEHGAWWKPQEHGYTKIKSEAGLYYREEAIRICESANCYTSDVPNEAMISCIVCKKKGDNNVA